MQIPNLFLWVFPQGLEELTMAPEEKAPKVLYTLSNVTII